MVAMGCGESCPVFPGKVYEDWPVADPEDRDLATVRAIIDDVERRVRGLLARLGRGDGRGLNNRESIRGAVTVTVWLFCVPGSSVSVDWGPLVFGEAR